MRKRLFSYLLVHTILLTSVHAVAQEQLSVSKSADISFRREEYAKAAGLYEKLLRSRAGKKNVPMIKQRLATCYRMYNQYEKAAYWYAQLLADSSGNNDNRLHYADMLKCLGRYDAAKQQYQQLPDQDNIRQRIAGCDAAVSWLAAPMPVTLKNEEWVNSSVNDWGMIRYGQEMVFVSDSLRQGMWDMKGSKQRYGRNKSAYGKLYSATVAPAGIGYSRNFSAVINNYPYHVGPACFSANGDTAYITVTDPERKVPFNKKDIPVYGTRRLKLLLFTKQGQQWQGPVEFPYNNNNYSVGHAALNSAGNILYFTSDRSGGAGGTDIWFCEKQADNSWGGPQNCGSNVNSPEDEAFPVTGNAATLFFASKGKVGMGGYDVFMVNGSKNNWSEAVNLKPPFNSSGDDFYYTTPTAQRGFIASNRPGGKGGDDIYSFAIADEIPATIPPQIPLLRIPLELEICVPSTVCVYLYNKTRDMGWCYMVMPPSRKIEAKLEPDAAYVVRVHYPDRIDSLAFDTYGVTGTDPLYKTICPPTGSIPAVKKATTSGKTRSTPPHKKRKHQRASGKQR
ncbi:tetratricopeptide repeat protein [Chitinophaga defluvii]|uniref:Tetratricopeptide repeat protein n=1 Tax=Chitinophaga defluvii TaxID=3163343 RepID=A0ABV2T374_9BACT